MRGTEQQTRRDCWCGNKSLAPFCAHYALCRACGTLVSQAGLRDEGYLVRDDESDFYGKKYWLEHQAQELGLPPIQERARLDLPERCLYWLRHLLSYRTPAAKVLELGAAHGAFVALMRWAGFDATGLEMSPWVAGLAAKTFEVPMLVGPIEQHQLPPASFDIIVANDVVEHLPDPLGTLGRAVDLLKPDGILAIQMPEYPDGKLHEELLAKKNRFLDHTQNPEEHLYLYSQRAARSLLTQLGLHHVEFHRPMFDYDMYFFASRQSLQRSSSESVSTMLQSAPPQRLVLGLLDKAAELDRVTELWRVAEEDRAARLVVINNLGEQLAEASRQRDLQLHLLHMQLAAADIEHTARLKAITDVERQLITSDSDASSHIQVINQLRHQLAEIDSDRTNRVRALSELEHQLALSETDRVARLRTITDLGRNLVALDEDRNARLRLISRQEQLVQELQATIAAQQRALEFLHTAGLDRGPRATWTWLAKKLARMILPAGLKRTIRTHMLRSPGWAPPGPPTPASRLPGSTPEAS